MNVIIDPNLPILCSVPSNPVPEGAHAGFLETIDGVKLRYARFAKTTGAAKGTICLVQGRTEFIEKYFETIADFQGRGFSVATFDWRGQGGSQRLIGNSRLGYVDTFDDYWTDLRSFHASILLPDCPPPYYLVGHSMGGLVSLYAGLRDRMMFERIFLSSPMVGLGGQPLSSAGMASVCEFMSYLGLGQLPVARRADKPASEMAFPGNPVTSDLMRFTRSVDVLKARPDLEIGAPTIRWVAAAMRAMARASLDDFPGGIKIPVLMLAAGRDGVVATAATEQLGLRMRTGRHMIVPSARHELFMENDAIRAQVLAAFDAFITEPSV
jgi:lysophospholipase